MNPFVNSDDFEAQLAALREVAEESNMRLFQDKPDPLFEEHANVFIKSYLVSACSVLEAFLQNEILYFVYEMKAKMQNANIPHNLTTWSAGAKNNHADRKFSSFEITLSDRELTERVSGNIDKTITAFSWVGVDLCSDVEFQDRKDFVSTRVTKRNAIIHDNDDASDLSFLDIIELVDEFSDYCRCVKRVVRNNSYISGD